MINSFNKFNKIFKNSNFINKFIKLQYLIKKIIKLKLKYKIIIKIVIIYLNKRIQKLKDIFLTKHIFYLLNYKFT